MGDVVGLRLDIRDLKIKERERLRVRDILAGKLGSRRHSTTTFKVLLAYS